MEAGQIPVLPFHIDGHSHNFYRPARRHFNRPRNRTCFILHSNIRRPIKKIVEKHAAGHEVLHVELPNQVSFLNRATLETTFKSIPSGGHILIDANNTDYIDPDILDLIHDFQSKAHGHRVTVSLAGFKDKYPKLLDRIQYIDFSTRELQDKLTPGQVLEILKDGNQRFREACASPGIWKGS